VKLTSVAIAASLFAAHRAGHRWRGALQLALRPMQAAWEAAAGRGPIGANLMIDKY
jgi:hypothetical protein